MGYYDWEMENSYRLTYVTRGDTLFGNWIRIEHSYR